MSDVFRDEDGDSGHYFDPVEDIAQECEDLQSWDYNYNIWTGPLTSVRERRKNFFRRIGLSSEGDYAAAERDCFNGENESFENRGAVVSVSTTGEDKLVDQVSTARGCEIGLKMSPDHLDRREVKKASSCGRSKMMDKWLRIWHSITNRKVNRHKNVRLDDCSQVESSIMMFRRVRARRCRKKLKELSAVFMVQEIRAHEGSILSMKFSRDGHYLASGGEDKIVKIWQVVEDEASESFYFSMVEKSKSLGKTTQDSAACVILPHKLFRILEKPLHIFQGHRGPILDLSWSNNNCLLSSSTDKTVRLWKIGVHECLKVFLHTDYVTCIQFNPVNNDHFISGSLDCKVRIWTISGCQVVLWTEMKDIITAISYCPDGKGGVIGSISGTCRFFNISDNYIQLESQVCLTNKRKLPINRITGVQYLPHDPSKLLVSCGDSCIRIIHGSNVISKYKDDYAGLDKAGSLVSAASFTPNGKHIISASEDSHVYLWNHINEDDESPISRPKKSDSLSFYLVMPPLQFHGQG